MNHGKPTKGWNQIMSLPRRMTVDHDDLYQEPVEALKSLREAPRRFDAMTLPANQEVVLPPIEGGNTMEFEVEIDSGTSPMVEINVLRSPGRGGIHAHRVSIEAVDSGVRACFPSILPTHPPRPTCSPALRRPPHWRWARTKR